jgi:predicted enzyme related to lactoylglutathione lyase
MIDGIALGNVMIDCADQQELCEFYRKLLGWEKGEMYGLPALTSDKGIVFLFCGEEDYVPPVWPEEEGRQQKQMHFDFQVPDVEAAVEYAKTLGAAKATEQFGGSDFVTMIDPAGHPFCICAQGNTP